VQRALLVLGLVLAATGCKQVFGLDEPGHMSDAQVGTIPSIGFAGPTTLTDEMSGLVMIPVLLSEPSEFEVSVAYSATDITATVTEDYEIETGRVTIPPGQQTGQLEITILTDIMSEQDETVELRLTDPRQAVLALDTNIVTISANVLPRITFATATSNVSEASTKVTPMVQLDVASPVAITANLSASGTATSGTDFSLTSTQVTIPAGQTTALVEVNIIGDTLDENDEDAVVTLVNANAAIVGTQSTHTVTIQDNDNAPTASFSTTSSSIAENGTTATLTVNLNTASGMMITVPYTLGGTAAQGMDYSITTSPLTFTPGTTSQTITVTMMDDLVDEANETVIVTLGTPTNAGLGANQMHTLTITDDEVTCVGPGAGNAFNVCYDSQPAGPATLPASLNTDTYPGCMATQPVGWTTTQAQVAACVIWATTVTGSTTTTVTGTRPLVIAATGTINITGTLDVASKRVAGTIGPGIPSNGCEAPLSQPQGGVHGAGGGPGGTFMTKGGNGGSGDNNQNAGGVAAAAQSMPTYLRAGCSGTRGGPSFGMNAGNPGYGGGAVYIASSTSITLGNNSEINASGQGATNGTPDNVGGSGGGSGGMIRLYAPAMTVTGATLLANGGGGAEGNTDVGNGQPGNDPNSNSPSQPAAGGAGLANGGNGGAGFAGMTAAVDGVNGSGTDAAGGGGGGGGGYIQSNVNLAAGGASVSAGSIVTQ